MSKLHWFISIVLLALSGTSASAELASGNELVDEHFYSRDCGDDPRFFLGLPWIPGPDATCDDWRDFDLTICEFTFLVINPWIRSCEPTNPISRMTEGEFGFFNAAQLAECNAAADQSYYECLARHESVETSDDSTSTSLGSFEGTSSSVGSTDTSSEYSSSSSGLDW